jgi:hypothetical protein
MPTRRLHQTTVRFGSDLWEALAEECDGLGVSVAQYVREAALARLMYAAGRRGDSELDSALAAAVENAQEQVAQSSAVSAQGKQARSRARELRDEIAQDWAERSG